MHIFLYEWITGGGLVEEPRPLPRSLLAEGAAMLTALAADLTAIDGVHVSALRDMRLDGLPLPGCEVSEVHSNLDRQDNIERLAAEADYTLVIAPETDGVLLAALESVRGAGGSALAPSDEFVRITADKHLTCKILSDAGLPTPHARIVVADEEKLPAEFDYPAVLKPVCGAGSQHTLLVTGPGDEPPPHPWPRRLERFCAGDAVSVSFLCGPDGNTPLPVFRQHLSDDGRFRYQGGSLLHEPSLATRATELAQRALTSLPAAIGYVGVDLVLGKSGDGSEDYVIEVNPRVTTSYVGLRAAARDNLAAAMLKSAAGAAASPRFRTEPIEFTADGSVHQPVS